MRAQLAIALPLALAGCATVTLQRDLSEIGAATHAATGVEPRALEDAPQRQAAAGLVDALLQQPLAADDAVRIALATSPAAQALLHESAVALAGALQGARALNPRVTFERLRRGAELEIGRLLSFDLLDLLTWPQRQRIAESQRARERVQAIGALLDLAHETRRAWVEAVAAEQALQYRRDVLTAAEAAAELASRLHTVGNYSRLQYAREQAFYAEAAAQLARAQHAAAAARERLVRALGLDRAQAQRLKLPERLPDLPPVPRGEPPLAEALEGRLDLRAARLAYEQTMRAAPLAGMTVLPGEMRLGLVRNRAADAPGQRGAELELGLPLFDAGDALQAQAQAAVRAAAERLRAATLAAQSELAQAYHAYRSAYDLARHYRDEVVPLRQAIAEENLLRYNGMLISVFELLADARERV
ncbi:MAG: TolC family protein, partial [Burkholderiaceae bacterium]|nr:TolC family protein [Burkholderiaceae bacterium]